MTSKPNEPSSTARVEAQIPAGPLGYLRAAGPGLVMALAWLSAGDLVASSAAGANYGYALMWALVLSLIARFIFVSAIAKYVLCSNTGSNSIMEGFARLWRPLPAIIGVIAFVLGFGYATYIIKGAATAFYHLIGRPGNTEWGIFVSACGLVAVTLVLLFTRRQYATLEWVARTAAIVLIGSFGAVVLIEGFDPAALMAGLTFDVPSDVGGFSALLIAVALIGGVGGSTTNLLYNYFMQDKGWRAPRHRKLQVIDLGLGIVIMVFVNLAIWIAAAEMAGGMVLSEMGDLATMLTSAIGQIGGVLLWLGLFFVTFTTFPSYSYGHTKLFMDGVLTTFTRNQRHDATVVESADFEKRASFRWLQGGVLLVIPLIFSLPGMPSFVAQTILVNALGAMTVPIVIVAVIVLTASRKFILPNHVNRWWETAAMLLVGGIGLWASYQTITGLLF